METLNVLIIDDYLPHSLSFESLYVITMSYLIFYKLIDSQTSILGSIFHLVSIWRAFNSF